MSEDLERTVEARLAALAEARIVERIWAGDHTVWRPDPTEIVNRLGWLTLPATMRTALDELRSFAGGCAADGLTTAVLAGMGGSSLAPEVFRETFGAAEGALDLVVLDSTHPDQILAVQRSLDLDRTLFVIASKSGTTTETLSHYAHFRSLVDDGSRFAAITDPGSPLEELGRKEGFRGVFLANPDVGGRYSALTHFGLVNAALVGVDLVELLDRAAGMTEDCGAEVPAERHPGAFLGAVLGESALAGRDKLTLVFPEPVRTLGWWIEQLIAESTGKEGKGILPVEGEDLGPPEVYGDDRLFIATGDAGGEALDALEDAGQAVARLPFDDVIGLGAEMYRWEFATAVAGAIIGIQPFDQPDVQSAKDATKRILSSGEVPNVDAGDARALLGEARPGDYVAIQAYVPRDAANGERLHVVRMQLRDRLRLATTVGFGPRFLHSTGQFHKGGPNTGVFLQVVDRPAEDVSIPGEPYTFGTLIAAQASGDLLALRDRGRRVARVSLEELEALA